MKYYFPLHIDGGNRGCEAIAKGTATILCEPKENLIGLATDIELDKRLGVGSYVTMIPRKERTLLQKIDVFIYKLLHRDRYARVTKEYRTDYDSFLNIMSSDGVMVSTGGDMMCYSDNQVIYTLNYAKKKGLKAMLFGCSMGEKNLTTRKLDALKNFDVLYARESLTEEFFKSLGLKNVICYPDPAFSLSPETVELPSFFNDNEIIGLNVSRMVAGSNSLNTAFGKELQQLIDYIILNTQRHILLVPHVLWEGQDDRIIVNNIASAYTNTGRVHVLDTDKYNYCEIRYIISKCRLFIGGRTHSVISAYSTCVPTIALGYSIKARGIAKDLGLNSKLVVDCVNYKGGELLASFKYLADNESEIRKHLEEIVPEYMARLKNVGNEIKTMLV